MEGYFAGEFAHALDDKGRLAIPAKFRGRFKEGAVVTRWTGECLAVWPSPEWNSLNADIAKRPRTDPAATRFRYLVLSGAHEGDPDGQGRLTSRPYRKITRRGASRRARVVRRVAASYRSSYRR